MKARLINELSEIDSTKFDKSHIMRKAACFSILSLFSISFGSRMLQAGIVHEQFISNSPATYTEIISPAYFSNLPTGRPSKGEADKDLSDLVQLAREIVGRIDMTSVSGGTLEETHDQKSSNSSLKVMDDYLLLSGQNTKHVTPQNSGEDKKCRTSEIRHDKSLIKESPANNPLSFAWEYLQTKK